MPAKCELPGLRFQYPENWTLDDVVHDSHSDSVTVYSPSGAFWSAARYPPSAEPYVLARAVVDAMRQEYDSLEAHQTRDTIAGHELVGYDLFFYCLDMTNTAQVRAASIRGSTCVVFQQAEDHDFEGLGPVFRAMSTSLFSEMQDLPWRSYS